jgi:hypothetical protein
MHNAESFANIGQKLRRCPTQFRTKSLLASAPNSILSQSTLSASLKPIYDYLDTEKKLALQVVKRLKDLEKRVRALQLLNSKQTTPDSYISISRGLVLSDNRASPDANV